MVQIDLTPKQVEELKNHYILELEKLQQRTTEIMGLLSKLVHGPVASITEKAGDTAEEKTKQRGRPSTKPKLSEFIIRILKEKNKPLTSEQLIKEYKKQYKIDLAETTSGMSAMNQTLFRLRKKLNLITSSRRKGKRGNVYSLAGPAVKPVAAKPVVAKAKPKKERKAAPAKKAQPAALKNNWSQFIIEMLNKHKRVLSLKDLLGFAMVQFSIPSQDKKSTYGKISPVLTQMAKTKDKIRSYKKDGKSVRFYALKEWFNDKNELITLYK